MPYQAYQCDGGVLQQQHWNAALKVVIVQNHVSDSLHASQAPRKLAIDGIACSSKRGLISIALRATLEVAAECGECCHKDGLSRSLCAQQAAAAQQRPFEQSLAAGLSAQRRATLVFLIVV